MINKWLFMLVCILPMNASAVVVSAEPSDATVNIGETFTVDLIADFSVGVSVLGWGLDLDFNSTIVSQVGVPVISTSWFPGGSLDGDGLAGLAFPAPVTGSDILLASLTFQALTEGTSNFLIGVTFGDLTEGFPLAFPAPPGSFASLQVVNSSIEVNAAQVPEPAILTLMALGLVGIGYKRH